MKNFTDKELTNVLLSEHKLAAASYTNLILESSNEFLRNDATDILNKTFEHQKEIFDIMSGKGWYQTQQASVQEITQAKQKVSSIQTS